MPCLPKTNRLSSVSTVTKAWFATSSSTAATTTVTIFIIVMVVIMRTMYVTVSNFF